jgi:UDP-N-acetylmuramate--alanine ligase
VRDAQQGVLGEVGLRLPGLHNVANALAAVAVGRELLIPFDTIARGLESFTGVVRRFENKGERGGVLVVDDYAHHPTEIAATLTAVRALLAERGTGRSLVVFQPHLYSRTKAFAAEFGSALDGADEVFVLDVYGAREQPLPGVSGASVAEHVSVPVHYLPDFAAVPEAVAKAAGPGDVIVTMGAGDVTVLGPEIVTALRSRADRTLPGRPGVL